MANLQQIEKYLKEKKIPYNIIDLGGEVYTVGDVVKSVVEEGEIVLKSISAAPENLPAMPAVA